MVLDFGGDKLFPTLIVGVEAPRYFAYRWASPYPGEQATEENSTLVEFTLPPRGTEHDLRCPRAGSRPSWCRPQRSTTPPTNRTRTAGRRNWPNWSAPPKSDG